MSRSTAVSRPGSTAELHHGALSLTGAVMQGVTHIAPTAGVILILQSEVATLGMATPFAFVIAIAIMFLIGVSIAQLARFLPSAGGFFTYISRTLDARVGWFGGWINLLYDPFGTAIDLAALGFVFNQALVANYSVNFPWWASFLIAGVIVTAVIYRGIEITGRTQLILGGLEILLLVAVSVHALVSPGPGGVTAAPFNPASSAKGSDMFAAIILAVFTFTGFESTAPLAEETARPRRNVPRAMLISLAIVGVFVVLCLWAMMIGWGTSRLPAMVSYAGNPVFEVAHRLWGPAWVLILLAIVNSLLSVSVATSTSATRVIYAMGRSRALPAWFGVVDRRFGTPRNAIIAQTVLTFGLGLGLGFAMGPFNEFLMIGVAITVGLALLYVLACLGVIKFFLTEQRRAFNPVLHVLVPVAAAVAVGFVVYHNVIPVPPYPINIALPLAGGWAVVGIVTTVYLVRTGRTGWLDQATKVFGEAGQAAETAESAGAAPHPGQA
ncbi:MAG TPA: APC family permease [Streptosporangiaceae bacterium]|nr:APC family permease [Streptosporangiaceae bacterium]